MKMLSGGCVEMNNPATIVICDTGPILHLDELDCLELLKDFQEVIVPAAVEVEIRRHRPDILKQHNVPLNVVPVLQALDDELLTLCRMFALHAGEIEALFLMKNYPGAIFLTDDSAARLVGQRMQYKVHGTIGILLRAIRRKMLTPRDVVELIRQIPARSTLHVKASLLNDIIEQLEREFAL